jgi:hypothetical protein
MLWTKIASVGGNYPDGVGQRHTRSGAHPFFFLARPTGGPVGRHSAGTSTSRI